MTYCSPNLNELTNMARTLPHFTQAPDVTQERSSPVLRIRIHMYLGLPDPDPLVRGMDLDPDPDPSIIMQK
jgi:hypothetical protein